MLFYSKSFGRNSNDQCSGLYGLNKNYSEFLTYQKFTWQFQLFELWMYREVWIVDVE